MLEKYLRKNFGKYVELGEFKDDADVERAFRRHRLQRRGVQFAVSALILLPVLIIALSKYGGGKGEQVTAGAEELFARGEKAFEQGRYEEAVANLEAAESAGLHGVSLLNACIMLGDAYYNITWRDREATYKKSLKYYLKALDAGSDNQLAPHLPRIYYQMGNCQRSVRALDRSYVEGTNSAIYYYDYVVDTFPASSYAPLALYYKGECLMDGHNFQEARKTFARLCEAYPEHELARKAFFRVGDCYVEEAKDLGSESYTGTIDLGEVRLR